ncbi:hypothetical protein Gohar_013556 [Gossypium harknessii]|uniref:Uncharacterized protein n=1 Tax=Gossypium harknessii TaxID=34285 RepID=A0A7J9H0N5_9ROSI|nr:hypothetical protein [Gossypium harknessii]
MAIVVFKKLWTKAQVGRGVFYQRTPNFLILILGQYVQLGRVLKRVMLNLILMVLYSLQGPVPLLEALLETLMGCGNVVSQ